MAHKIEEFDKGVIAFAEKLGQSWHGIKSYVHYPKQVPFEAVEKVANYKVEKRPLYMETGEKVKGAFTLYRPDIEKVLYPAVGDRYTTVNNDELIRFVENSILEPYENIKIESAGTLENGRQFFINLIVTEHTVSGDVSPTVTRLMFTNAHGGRSLNACLHQTRIVCNNTLRISEAQGKANATLKSFRHTAGASDKVKNHVLDLAEIIGEIKEHNQKLDLMTEQKVTTKQVKDYLEQLFPTAIPKGKEVSRIATINKDKQSQIFEIYKFKPDLTSLAKSKYRFLNAVTDYTSNQFLLKGKIDNGKRFMSSVSGSADKVNQKVMAMLAS